MEKYHGSCHCGAVRFTVEGTFTEGLTCNCSHCHRKGFILSFIPKSQLVLHSGEELLTTYQFHQKKIDHRFCAICGVQTFGESGDTIALNLRCLENFDTESLLIQKVDGKSF